MRKMTMSKPKYKQGKQITSMADFEKYTRRYFKVYFGNHSKTIHRAFLESWQYHTLYVFITRGFVYEADFIEKEHDDLS